MRAQFLSLRPRFHDAGQRVTLCKKETSRTQILRWVKVSMYRRIYGPSNTDTIIQCAVYLYKSFSPLRPAERLHADRRRHREIMRADRNGTSWQTHCGWTLAPTATRSSAPAQRASVAPAPVAARASLNGPPLRISGCRSGLVGMHVNTLRLCVHGIRRLIGTSTIHLCKRRRAHHPVSKQACHGVSTSILKVRCEGLRAAGVDR